MRLGETVYEAAVRETFEETGVETRPLGVVNVDDAIAVDDDGRVRYHYVLVTVLLEPVGGVEPRAGSDAGEARFFGLREALGLDLTDSTRGLILKILEGRVPLEKPIPAVRYTPRD